MKKRIKFWFVEYYFVINYSRRAYAALVLAVIAPVVIFSIGAWILSDIDASGPYAPMVAAVVHSLAKVLLGMTLIMQVKFFLIAAEQYRKARRRLGL
jgi:hypothetical protein